VEVNKHNFVAPIPGMSLTTEPKSRPWESPPKMTSLSEVVDYYSERLSDPTVIGPLLRIVKKGVPIHDLSMGFTKVGLMQGLHTVDVGVLASPVITEIIKTAAELNDVDYVLTMEEADSKNTIDKDVAEDAFEMIQTSGLEEKILDEAPEVKTGLMARGKKDE